jgi:hypothetical protein
MVLCISCQTVQSQNRIFFLSELPSIAVFFPAILFPTNIDRYFPRTSCTCFGIVFILVPYLIVCALVRFQIWNHHYFIYSLHKFMKYKPLDCLAFGPDWKKSNIILLDILMLIFQPFILFPTNIDRYFPRTSCTCFGIVFILVPYLIVCALVRFQIWNGKPVITRSFINLWNTNL